MTTGPSLRLVTVTFCDLVDSTSIMAELPTERWDRVLDRYYELVGGQLTATGARLEKFIGDAVVAVLGVTSSQDPDPEVMVRAAMDAVASISEDPRLRTVGPRQGLRARAAVVSGRVLVDPSRESSFAVGRVMHRAARLQSAAPPGGVVVDLVTRLLLRDRLPTTALPPRSLAGFERPVPAFLAGGTPAAARSPLVGRTGQLTELVAQVRSRVDAGATGWITVTGEAGIGKTRLVEELVDVMVAGRQHAVVVSCQPSRAQETTVLLDMIAALAPHDPEPAIGPGVSQSDLQDTLRLKSEAAGQQQTALILDDVQRLSGQQAETVASALRSLPATVAVVLTGRQVPAELAAHATERIDVTALAAEHLHLIWRQVVGEVELHSLDAGELAVARAGGNPLFLKELAVLTASGEQQAVLPPSAELLTEALLSRIEPAAVELVSVIAMAGGTLPVEDFVELFAASGAAGGVRTDAAVAAAVRAGLVTITDAGLTHGSGLITDVIRARLPLAQQAGWHSRLAAGMRTRLPKHPAVIEQIAHHTSAAAQAWSQFDPDSGESARSALRAADTLVEQAGFTLARADLDAAAQRLDEAETWLLAGGSAADGSIHALRSALALAGGNPAAAEGIARAALERVTEPGGLGSDGRGSAHLAARAARARIVAGLDVPPSLRHELLAGTSAADPVTAVCCLLVEGFLAALAGDYVGGQAQLTAALSRFKEEPGGLDGAELYGNLGLFLLFGDTPADQAGQACASMIDDVRDADLMRAALLCPYAALTDAAGRPGSDLLDESAELFAALKFEAGALAVQEFRADLLLRRGLIPDAAKPLEHLRAEYQARGLTRDRNRLDLLLAIVRGTARPPDRLPDAPHDGGRTDWLTASLTGLARASDSARPTSGRQEALADAIRVITGIRGAGARTVPLVLGAWLVHTGQIDDDGRLLRLAQQAARTKGDQVVLATLDAWSHPSPAGRQP